jgi:predicted unusual protein kinase regulating ubiquinone biosynthesis (AarF/ABC1/UbiB family)
MELVRGLLAATRSASGHRKELDGVGLMLRQIEARLHEEVDYLAEARATAWFHAQLRHPQLVVPEPVPQFSTARVLTTSLLRGDHLEAWLAKRPAKAEIDRLGQVLCEVFFISMFELGRVHTDPNPGNYLFLEDGRLGLVDFGCTDRVAPGVARFFGECTRAYAERDLDAAIAKYQEIGLIPLELSDAQRADYYERMQPSCEWVALAFGAQSADFAVERGIIAKMREAMMRLGPALNARDAAHGPVPDMLFLSRAFVGLFRILVALGAEVEIRKLLPTAERLRELA